MRSLKDNEVKVFEDASEMADFFEQQKETDLWKEPYLGELRIADLPNCPILLEEIKRKNDLETYMDETVLETMEGNGLLLSLPGETKRVNIPLRDTAFVSACARAGLEGPALKKAKNENKEALIEILNNAFPLWMKGAKVLIRDEKVSAIHSEDYCVMPTIDLFRILEGNLDKDFPGWEVTYSCATHESSIIEIELRGQKDNLLNTLNRAIKRSGREEIDGIPVLLFCTSDTAARGVHLYPYIKTDDMKISIGSPIRQRHIGSNEKNYEEFKNSCKQVYSLFRAGEEQIKQLLHTRIYYPSDCLLRLAAKIGISKKCALEVANTYVFPSAESTAYDIYWALWKVNATYDASSLQGAIQLEENIARSLHWNYAEYDIPVDWGE